MSFWLVMKTADEGEHPFPISKERTVIGRGVESDLRVAMPTVARRHCELRLENEELTLTDLGSSVGTLRNGSRVSKAVLAHSDRLTVGTVTFEVRMSGANLAQGTIAEVKTRPLPTNVVTNDNGRPKTTPPATR